MQGLPKKTGVHTRALFIGPVVVALVLTLTFPAGSSAHSRAHLSRTERHIVGLINNIRRHYGLPLVRVSGALDRAADRHSVDMARAQFFEHNSSSGASAGARVRSFRNARAVGENLAFLPRHTRNRAYTVVDLWMHSAPHRAVILSPLYRRIGVAARSARINGGRGTVYTADFTSRR
jgi:uncharacterized protein YkwD